MDVYARLLESVNDVLVRDGRGDVCTRDWVGSSAVTTVNGGRGGRSGGVAAWRQGRARRSTWNRDYREFQGPGRVVGYEDGVGEDVAKEDGGRGGEGYGKVGRGEGAGRDC